MEIELEPGTYVVAVSGGVDSVVLLDVLYQRSQQRSLPFTFVVAHYNHGIRTDADEDQQFVRDLAKRYGLPYVTDSGKLGQAASEATAREARYHFLERARQEYQAEAIITAHHQDDVIETILLNMLRGTGRRGFSSLRSTATIRRPLLDISKLQLRRYAKQHHLSWHEDSTNADDRYKRNYIRHHLVPKLSSADRQQLVAIHKTLKAKNEIMDALLHELLTNYADSTTMDRQWFMGLPHDVAREVLIAWLRQAGVTELDKVTVERLVVLAKTLVRGKLVDVNAKFWIKIEITQLALLQRER